VRTIYTRALVQRGDITDDEERDVEAAFRARLDQAFAETHAAHDTGEELADALDRGDTRDRTDSPVVVTAVARPVLERVVEGITHWPDDVQVNPKLARQLEARRTAFDEGDIDWALGEALAFGSLVLEGVPVRLAGQDTRRGTFSQRHGVLVSETTEREYVPLAHLADDQAPFMLYDTVLSEYAALGFEYGYSVASDALVCWEAQFGDFANGAQIVIDQFVVAAADKWGQRSRIALLLPHGFEGQGPEHSSARIERYLVLSAENNLRVVYPSTAAQYFHTLRRQAAATEQVPLVCFTPKRYLRMPQSRSPLSEFTDGSFAPVLDDRAAGSENFRAAEVTRVLVCTGKIGHELMEERDTRSGNVAIVRVEQLYPWPDRELDAVLSRYPNAQELVWVQEEPSNMGAWSFVAPRLDELPHAARFTIRMVARAASASPATGSIKVHEREQREVLENAFR
jgi:2-oxoglutarate dehydrogenase complex dehydrogenase (E1) component-like enzyme